MRWRSAILVVVALTLVLLLRERSVLRRGAGSATPQAVITSNRPLSTRSHSEGRAAPVTAAALSDTLAPGKSRFDEALAELPVPAAATDTWAAALDRLADSVPAAELGNAVRELAGAASESPRAMLRDRLLTRWTRLAPKAAAGWTLEIDNSLERREAALQVAVAWAESDLPGAVAWAGSMSNETERDELVLQLAHETIRAEPLRALELAAGLPPGRPRDELLAQTAGNWALRDPQGAADWVSSLDAAAGRMAALEAVVVNWAVNDPIAAAQYAVQHLPSGRTLDRAVVAVVER